MGRDYIHFKWNPKLLAYINCVLHHWQIRTATHDNSYHIIQYLTYYTNQISNFFSLFLNVQS